ncbi:MAG: hypothetical protein NDI81_06995 [Desulfobacula sp.]|jgi:hypothetical protein|nr:hypothetical protein [Desulfobacula sp.]
MSSVNLMFLELQVKEYQTALEKEAEYIRMVGFARKEYGSLQRRGVEKFADLLISMGEFLKRKYGPACPKNFRTGLNQG